jgi:hypothetical protein
MINGFCVECRTPLTEDEAYYYDDRCEWCEMEKTMTYEDACVLAECGTKVRRPIWNDETYLEMRGKCPTVVLGAGTRICMPAAHDKAALDWVAMPPPSEEGEG